jgi:hypothetical protein
MYLQERGIAKYPYLNDSYDERQAYGLQHGYSINSHPIPAT